MTSTASGSEPNAEASSKVASGAEVDQTHGGAEVVAVGRVGEACVCCRSGCVFRACSLFRACQHPVDYLAEGSIAPYCNNQIAPLCDAFAG